MSNPNLSEDALALGRALHQANAHLRDLLCDPDADLADIANACDAAARRYDEFAEHLDEFLECEDED